MYLTLIYLLTTTIIVILMTTIILITNKKNILDMEKSSPFECGFNPMSNKRLPFSIHFFLIAVIFLIFDVEVIIILPSLFSMKYSMTMNWMITLVLFMLTLIMGTFHEWKNGMLDWTK
uniref:NADH-ubiquinone oxidoreductase chain 3 n=1 Tax=Balala fujiana TaxID=2800226 RepID=A0A7T6YCS0_9HEMI|nr:NADH dehydrogenase subunit 3 [Balala fujiana]QQK57700.1 NADH dehydrogenase subunit 3 [Balala fujiana]